MAFGTGFWYLYAMPVAVTESVLRSLLANLGRYLANLARAGPKRREESRAALQGVIRATRQTRVYVRELAARGLRNFEKEERLSDSWTTLSFELRKLGVPALAKRCDIAGSYWADPGRFTDDFLKQARARLEDLELEAKALLKKL